MASIAKIIIQAVDQASMVLKNISNSGDQLAGKLKSSFSKIGDVGRDLMIAGGAGVAAFGMIINEAAKFEGALKNTMTMTGLQGKALSDMEKTMGGYAMTLSQKFGLAGEEINTAFYQVLSSGAQVGTEQFKKLTEVSLKLNKTVGIDTSQAVETLSDSLHAFGMDVSHAGKMADVFFKASMLGATTVPQLMEAMKTAAPAAKLMGISLEETASILTLWASKGIKGGEAGMAFRQIMLRLISPTKEAKDGLDALGVSVYNSDGTFRGIVPVLNDMKLGLSKLNEQQGQAALKAIAGEHAFSRLAGLLQTNLSTITDWTTQLNNAGGALDVAFAQKMQGMNEQVKIFIENIKALAVTIGSQLVPILTPIINQITGIVRSITEWVSKNSEIAKWVVIIGGIGSVLTVVIGAVLLFVGAIGGAVAGIMAGAAAVPTLIAALAPFAPVILAIIAALTLVTAAIALVAIAWFKNWGGIQEKTKAVIDFIMNAWKVFSDWMIEVWDTIWNAIEPTITEMVTYIKTEWDGVVKEVMPILEEFWNGLVAGWKAIQPAITIVMGVIKDVIVTFVITAMQYLKFWFDFFKAGWEYFKVIYNTIIKPGMDAIGQIIQIVFDKSRTPVQKFMDILKVFANTILSIGSQIVENLWKGMQIKWLQFEAWYNDKFGVLSGMIKAMTGLQNQVSGTPTKGGSASSLSGSNKTAASLLSTNPALSGGSVSISVGTFIGDDSGLRQLETKLNKFRLETAGRYAV